MTNSTGAPLKANWSEQKEKLIAKFSTLTKGDLHYATGKKEEMMTNVQEKTDNLREEFGARIS
ncbi:MAG: general stress protein CsbD [Bacteroidota bacterium]